MSITSATPPRRSRRGRFAALDRAIVELGERRDAWLAVPLEEKIGYLRRIARGTLEVAERQVAAAAAAKGLPADSPLTAEDWLGGPFIQIRTLRLLAETLERFRRDGKLGVEPSRLRRRPDGRLVAEVFPADLLDRLLFAGFRGEVWMRPGVTEENLDRAMGAVYRRPPRHGRVALVLGAGNVASIGTLDVVQKLFAEGRVALLKFNPVNDYLGPFVEEAFAPLIRDGFLRLAYGGAETGDYLCRHEGIDEIHITGSAATHDAIVFGTGTEGARRRRDKEPRLEKPISSELGNVSPVIVLPGRWSEGELEFHAENVATQMTQNCGFNCNAAKVLITWERWPQRRDFLNHLRRVLRRLPERPAYYPGAEERYDRFLAAYPRAEPLGTRREGVLPPTLIAGVDHRDRDGLAFTTESFCPITAETALPGDEAAGFLRRAVDFCNRTLYGTLNAGLIVDPATQRRLGGELEQAIADLRYGSVGVNHWAAISYGLGSTTWGAFPGHTLDDIQSGIGTVHNALLFDKPEKSVVTGPFRVRPKPAWFVTHRGAHRVAAALARVEADPSLLRLPQVVWHAIGG